MSWTEYKLIPRGVDSLPKKAGAYAVYFDGRLVYIGQSVSIANRFFEHRFRYGYGKNIHTPWGQIDGETVITVKVKESRRLGDWAMWEIRLIDRLKPEMNTHYRKRRAA